MPRPKRLEVRQKGKHYRITDERGRVHANESNAADAEASFKRLLTGHGKEAGMKGPKPKHHTPRYDAGKGDGTRPRFVSNEQWAENFRRTFGR